MSKLVKLVRAADRARLATYLIALWKLFKHPQTPRSAKLVAIAVLAYAVSPIDLIPDFIPVLGQLDDLVLVPLGVALAVRLTPRPLWEARLREAEASRDKLPRILWGAGVIVVLWLVLFGLFVWWAASALVS
ncbi:YkvA family protein [Aquabacterium sp. A7-Y]|uniref:YkvA family protein n=1 Tax=Aquabacterium sp. A7-Y TaxID=1349605 RepID=UPI00223DEC58|nr:YkvA family protein [Aquabacterium sp. A7-Y]MCW7541517.1 YkvA family protein [Aquabacterium sp. A7-Y]